MLSLSDRGLAEAPPDSSSTVKGTGGEGIRKIIADQERKGDGDRGTEEGLGKATARWQQEVAHPATWQTLPSLNPSP